MKTRLVSTLAALLSATLLTGTLVAADLKGRILDPEGKIVASAQVRLFDRKTGEIRSTTSSSEGGYSFQQIPTGNYLLEADASNVALNGSMAVAVDGNQSQDLKLAISATSTNILVTASGVPLSTQEIAKAIDVIDAEELSMRNEFSLAEAVRTLPGVRVQTLEGPGTLTSIAVRGLRAQDTAILVDGMRFHDAGSPQNDATAFLGDMVTTDTDRIEFLRGSGSSLYGSNAVGGVININSRSGGSPTRGNFRFEGGGLGLVRAVAGLSGGLLSDRFTYSGTGSHVYVTKGVRDGLHYRNNSAQGSAKYSFTPGISLTGRAWYSNGYVNSTMSPSFNAAILANSTNGTEVPAIALPIDQLELFETNQPFTVGNATFIPNAIDPDGRRRSSYFSGMLVFQHQVGPSTSYRVAYQAVDTRRAYLYGPLGPPGSFFGTTQSNFNGYVDTVQARLDQQTGRHNLITFGYEYEQENYFEFNGNSDTAEDASRIDLKQRSNAFYIQDQLNLLDGQLQLTAAARAQVFGLMKPEFQGSSNPYTNSISSIDVPTAYTGDGAAAYFVRSSQTKLRAHVGNSYRAPSGYERFGGFFGLYIGDPRLGPERSVAVDAGVDQWILGSKAQLSATWFYTNLQETIGYANSLPSDDPFGRLFGYARNSGRIARGVELSGNVSPRTSTKIRASYTYLNSDSRTPTVAPDYYRVLGLSPNIVTVTATQYFGSRTSVTFDLAAYSDYVVTLFGGGTRRFKFNGPIKPDLIVSRRVFFGEDHSAEIYGKLENMFGQRPYESGNVGPKAWFTSGVRINY